MNLTLEEHRAGKRPPQYGVFEREPQYASPKHPILLGPYPTAEEAEIARKKYGYDRPNFYVAPL